MGKFNEKILVKNVIDLSHSQGSPSLDHWVSTRWVFSKTNDDFDGEVWNELHFQRGGKRMDRAELSWHSSGARLIFFVCFKRTSH